MTGTLSEKINLAACSFNNTAKEYASVKRFDRAISIIFEVESSADDFVSQHLEILWEIEFHGDLKQEFYRNIVRIVLSRAY